MENTENKETGGTAQFRRCPSCLIIPGMSVPGKDGCEYGNSGIRARIVPLGKDAVCIAGWKGVFDILPYDGDWLLLDNGAGMDEHRRTALISVASVRALRCWLEGGSA